MDRAVASWVRLAKRDIRSARLLVAADPDNALYLCQQAVEKALKAHVQQRTGELPPKTHHLLRLADLAGLGAQVVGERLDLVKKIGPAATLSRYPLTPEGDLAEADPDEASGVVRECEEAVEWLLSRL